MGIDGGAYCQCESGFIGNDCSYPVMSASYSYSDISCQKTPLELVFIVDTSGSAKAKSEFLRSAKVWIKSFVEFHELARTTQVGIVSFGEEAKEGFKMSHKF